MKKSTLFLFIALTINILTLSSNNANAQKGGVPTGWSIGLRLGDPLGLTLKKHFGGNKAFEFNLGRTNVYGFGRVPNSGYYYDRYNKKHFNDGDWDRFGYKGYYPKFDAFAFQFHYIIHKDIKPVAGLRWYFGFGPQVQIVRFGYTYYDVLGRPIDESELFVNLGLDGTGGIEYSFKGVPLTVFADITLYMELFREPFRFKPQGGIGARYNF